VLSFHEFPEIILPERLLLEECRCDPVQQVAMFFEQLEGILVSLVDDPPDFFVYEPGGVLGEGFLFGGKIDHSQPLAHPETYDHAASDLGGKSSLN